MKKCFYIDDDVIYIFKSHTDVLPVANMLNLMTTNICIWRNKLLTPSQRVIHFCGVKTEHANLIIMRMCSNQEIFLHDFLVILKHSLQNYSEVMKKYLLATRLETQKWQLTHFQQLQISKWLTIAWHSTYGQCTEVGFNLFGGRYTNNGVVEIMSLMHIYKTMHINISLSFSRNDI